MHLQVCPGPPMIRFTPFATMARLGVLATCCAAAWAQVPQTHLPRTSIGAAMHLIDAQVALTPEQHQTGLMWRQELPANEGMLFVFPKAGVQCFWMKNTLLPLTAAFVANDGRIVNLADMRPLDETSHCSKEPVRFVLEVNQGWFAKRGLKAGDRLRGTPFQSPCLERRTPSCA